MGAVRTYRAQRMKGRRMPVGVTVRMNHFQQHRTSRGRGARPVALHRIAAQNVDADPLAGLEIEVVGGQREERVVAGDETRVGATREQRQESLIVYPR